MKIAIVQVYNDNIKDYAEYSRTINSMYAQQKGYEYICWTYDLVPLTRSVFFNKVLAIYKVFKSDINCEWVLYLDSDAIVTNFSVDIETIIAKHEGKEFIVGSDKNGQNAGVILIKNTPKMADFLLKSYNDPRFFGAPDGDQGALFTNIQQAEYSATIGFEPAQFFNSYLLKYKNMKYDEPLWDDTSFILHLQRYTSKQRRQVFQQFLGRMHICYINKEDI